MVELLYAHSAGVITRKAAEAVPLFGAIEIRQMNGPLTIDRAYERRRTDRRRRREPEDRLLAG